VEGALNKAKRPSDDVVQTAPVKCRYTQSGFAQHRRLLPLQAGEFRGCRAAMTPEQEKRWYVSSPPSSDVPAVRARPLRGAPPGSLQFPGKAFERSKHVQHPHHGSDEQVFGAK